jgi:3-carboxy-cis,cis-muconate cycloisomerase
LLAEKIGKGEAHHLVEAASRKALAEKKEDLRKVLAADPRITVQLDVKKLADLFEPMAYQGASQALIDRLLASQDT